MDTTVGALLRAARVTGIGIAILNDGRVSYLNAYGFRDKEQKLPLTPDSVMTSASLSKAAFALMVMQLVQDGILDLDKPVYRYLPRPVSEYEKYKDLAGDPRYKKVTARMLLSHTSGFPNWRRFTEDGKLTIHFEPGTRYAYSGEGIDLLQLVVETRTGKKLDQLMRQRVFEPLGMNRSSMVWESRFENDFANAYDEEERSLGPQRRKTADAAGSMQTTLRDFARLMCAVLNGEGLQPEALDLMLSPQVEIRSRHQFPTLSVDATDANQAIRLSYGLGWGLYFSPYGKAFFKEGHDDGFRHYAVGFEKPKSGIVLMTNSSNGEGIFKELLEKLQRNIYTPIDWEGYSPYNQKEGR